MLESMPLDLSDRIQSEINRIVPPPCCVSVEAITQLRPLFTEVFALRNELAQLRAEIEAAWVLFANAGVMKFDDAGHERLWNTQAEKWAKRNRRLTPPSERDTKEAAK